MTQLEILAFVAEKCTEITGHNYVVDYTPQRNISDSTSATYRCVKPGSLRFNRLSRVSRPFRSQQVVVGLFSVSSDTNQISELQEELTAILSWFMSGLHPVQFKSGNKRATVELGECNPVQDSGIVLAGLEDDPPVIVGTITLGFLID